MKIFNKQTLILMISVISINLLCIISVSYAYFTAKINGNDTAKEMEVTVGTMKITYADSNDVSLINALPGDSISKQFKIVNTGTLDTKYNIKIDMETNEFEDYSDLEYTLTKNSSPRLTNEILPYEDGYIIKDEEIGEGTTDTYTLTLKFKADGTNQNDNANKKLNFKIEVDSKDDIKLYEYKEPYRDNSGANRPKLYQGMIPIYFNDGKIYIADVTKEWYNYDNNEWGNAVLIDNTNPTIKEKFYNEDGTLRINNQITEEDILQMYVWIPRYKYQLFNADNQGVPKQIINIEFEKGVTSTGNVSCTYTDMKNGTVQEDCENAINGNWYTHPAFTFGETELPGIWVGKFEPSDPDDANGRKSDSIGDTITILPNKTSMVLKTVSTMFYAERDMEEKHADTYNISSEEIDTHMMKNMEWGAVAYLTQSIYGIYKDESHCNITGMEFNDCEVWINNTSQGAAESGVMNDYGGTYTGCVGDSVNAVVIWNKDDGSVAKCAEENRWNKKGINASTTGNMYGIYDMSGGAWEYVMGALVNKIGGELYIANSGFKSSNLPESKYYDMYTFSDNPTTHEKGHLGDATREILLKFRDLSGGWNSDWTSYPEVTSSYERAWFRRSGRYDSTIASGIFLFHRWAGSADRDGTFRSVLSAA